MVISAQISIYPLRQMRLTPAVQAVNQALADAGLQPEVGSMSTLVTGEADLVFGALRQAIIQVASTGHVVMTTTLSNACPVER
jgi:uncharacterized protein YqgV (UPF0045/DUF77 family)